MGRSVLKISSSNFIQERIKPWLLTMLVVLFWSVLIVSIVLGAQYLLSSEEDNQTKDPHHACKMFKCSH